MSRTASENLRAAAEWVESLPPILRETVDISVKGEYCSAHWRGASPDVARAAIAAFPAQHAPADEVDAEDDDYAFFDDEWNESDTFLYRFDRRPESVVTSWWIYLEQVKPTVAISPAALLAEARA